MHASKTSVANYNEFIHLVCALCVRSETVCVTLESVTDTIFLVNYPCVILLFQSSLEAVGCSLPCCFREKEVNLFTRILGSSLLASFFSSPLHPF